MVSKFVRATAFLVCACVPLLGQSSVHTGRSLMGLAGLARTLTRADLVVVGTIKEGVANENGDRLYTYKIGNSRCVAKCDTAMDSYTIKSDWRLTIGFEYLLFIGTCKKSLCSNAAFKFDSEAHDLYEEEYLIVNSATLRMISPVSPDTTKVLNIYYPAGGHHPETLEGPLAIYVLVKWTELERRIKEEMAKIEEGRIGVEPQLIYRFRPRGPGRSVLRMKVVADIFIDAVILDKNT